MPGILPNFCPPGSFNSIFPPNPFQHKLVGITSRDRRFDEFVSPRYVIRAWLCRRLMTKPSDRSVSRDFLKISKDSKQSRWCRARELLSKTTAKHYSVWSPHGWVSSTWMGDRYVLGFAPIPSFLWSQSLCRLDKKVHRTRLVGEVFRV